MVKLSPSILSADFSEIKEAVRTAEKAGADLIHIDVMDGHFVPNLTFGPQLVSSLKGKTSLPLCVHLMVDNPSQFIPMFHEAGADWISIHLEATSHLHKDITMIKNYGKMAGLALNPATPIIMMNDIVKDLDYILLMTVNPGLGGQSFISTSCSKIASLKSWLKGLKCEIPVEVDGGVKLENMEKLIDAGADILVVGSGIFREKSPGETINKMKKLIERKHYRS